MKRYRIMKIKEIIQSQIIETQEELANALKKEGIIVTQATVSRDIKDLMLLKIPYGDGHYRYALPSEKPNVMSKSHTAILFQEAVIRIDEYGSASHIAGFCILGRLCHRSFQDRGGHRYTGGG